MTPTPEQLAAVLPRCSAGLDGGDWTDDDDRLAWATKVLEYVEAATPAERPIPPSRESRTFDDLEGARRAFFDWSASQVPKPPERGSTGHTEANPGKSDRDLYGPKHGDRWVTRNGRAVVVASNDWPPPPSWVIWHPLPPAPGVTYYYRQGFGK